MIRPALVAFAITVGAALVARASQSEPLPEFVEIPAGSFLMGTDRARDPDAFDNERWSATVGQGTVHLPRFYIARHEVTVAQFAAFVGATSWKVDPRALAAPPAHPVTFVSWPDALAYARWLETHVKTSASAPKHLQQLVRDGWRVTLPNEAEWEKAARGSDGRRYPWGNQPRRDRANFAARTTTPVGQFPCPECAHGLSDMSGNVWEWTSSPYRPYPFDPAARADLNEDALWVMRGGHFGDDARLVRTAARGAADPGARRPFIGFRVAVTPPKRASPARGVLRPSWLVEGRQFQRPAPLHPAANAP